jgi:hypothetical protein
MTLLLGITNDPSELVLLIIAQALVAIPILLIPKIFYLITLQSTLRAISEENRKMPPNNVWLQLIRLFGIVWHFIIVKNMADSISEEANLKNIKIDEQKPAYNIGLAMCILDCFFIIPYLNFLTGVASLICFILYWIKINSYKGKIINSRFS